MSRIIKDFRGIKCPINFAKTKIELSQMNKDDILELYIDDGSAINNLPDSVEKEGHKVLSKEKEKTGGWKIIIQKN